MLKFMVLFVLLGHEMCQFSCHANQDFVADTLIGSPKINETDMQMEQTVIYNFNVSQHILYVNGPLVMRSGSRRNLNSTNNIPRTDYIVTGTDAHKVHRRALPWNKARRTCAEEGAHLAVIRSEAEEKVVLKMMTDLLVPEVWVGYHDQFDEGDWISVFDERLDESGWPHWSKNWTPNPDNYEGKEDCARLKRDGGGLDDQNCDEFKMFLCKRSAL